MRRGFSFLEVIVSILILGILSLIAFATFTSRIDESLLLRDFTEKFKSDLRYIRQQSIIRKGTYTLFFSYPTVTSIFTNYYYIDPPTNLLKDAYSSTYTGNEITQLKKDKYSRSPVKISFKVDGSTSFLQTNVLYFIFNDSGNLNIEPSTTNSVTVSVMIGTYSKNLFINSLGFISEVNSP